MENRLMALGPIDGRYATKTIKLGNYFSEHALFKYRVKVELAYLKKLLETVKSQLLTSSLIDLLKKIEDEYSISDTILIKESEKVTNHDVKAVEYFIKNILRKNGFEEVVEWVHFGLTSNDINNTAIPLSLLEFHKEVFIPSISKVVQNLEALSKQ